MEQKYEMCNLNCTETKSLKPASHQSGNVISSSATSLLTLERHFNQPIRFERQVYTLCQV